MNQRITSLIFYAVFLFFGFTTNGQLNLTTVTITSDKAAHVNSIVNINYNNTTFEVGTYASAKGLSQSYRRAFVEFNIAAENIPAGAIIYSATLDITHDGTVHGSNPWRAKLVTTSWVETNVKAQDQPVISGLSGDLSSTYTTSGNIVKLDVKNMVQRMVYNQITNYGWSLQVNNEGQNARTGAVFYSDEHGTTSLRPKLVIKYYMPLSITGATIVHESTTGAADGSISFTYANGGSTNYLYSWYNGAGTSLPSGASLNNLTAGWYGVKMSGDDGMLETFYYAFLVGTECEEVTINFAAVTGNNFEKYVDNALCSNYNNITYLNGGENVNFQSSREFSGSAYSTNSYMRFNLWMDDELVVKQADMTLQGSAHAGTVNSSEFRIATSPWNESLIAWSKQPTIGATTATVPQTSGATQDKVVDLTNFWDEWKDNNPANHGMLFQLQSFANYTNKQHYHSPTAGAVADRPNITFKLELKDQYHCSDYTFYLKDEVEQSIAFVPGNTLKFKFEEDYFDTSGNLDYSIILLETDAQQSGTISKTHLTNWFELENGVGGVTLTSGKIYLLKVENTKGQKAYLKFKMS